MKLTFEKAKELVGKFRLLQRYPKADESGSNYGEQTLIESLMEAARSEEQAAGWVKDWIKNNPKCPMPCDIYQGLESSGPALTKLAADFFPPLKPGEQPPPASYYCNLCEDSGWYMVKGTKPIPDAPGQFYEGAKKCHHPPECRGTKPYRE